MLLTASVAGPVVRCTLIDVMTPDLVSKRFADVPHSMGHPLVMAADVMHDGRFFVRIVCANGIHVLHRGGRVAIAGNYGGMLAFPQGHALTPTQVNAAFSAPPMEVSCSWRRFALPESTSFRSTAGCRRRSGLQKEGSLLYLSGAYLRIPVSSARCASQPTPNAALSDSACREA
jgi:hypothetical protein